MSDNLKSNQYPKFFLLVNAIALIPVSLTYGFLPEGTLDLLYGIETTVNDINLKHMMKALMGVYLAMVFYWFIGAYKEKHQQGALRTLIFFMFGVATGRLFSFLIDGIPDWPFIFFFFAEIVIGAIGLRLLNNINNS